MDEDGGDAKESEVTRDGQSGVAVHLYWSRLQPLPIAKPNGPSMYLFRESVDENAIVVPLE